MQINYRQILDTYDVKEEGDFFKLFFTSKGKFIIYKPTADKISCIEMINFNDISVYDLSLFLDVDLFNLKNIEEFKFDVSVDKNTVLRYIFDISSLEDLTSKYKNSIQPFKGYILKDTSKNNRNLFQIGELQNQILYDNYFTFVSNNKSIDKAIVCFDSKQYDRLVSNTEIADNYAIYLLASGSFFLYESILSNVAEVSVKLGNEDPIEVLKLYTYLINRNNPNSLILDYNVSQIALAFNKQFFEIEDILNSINLAQKELRSKIHSSVKICYEIKSQENFCFVVFRNSNYIVSSYNTILSNKFNLKISEIQ